MDYQDYYQTLGVPRTASQAEIKKAFRRLARENHPDARPGDATSEQRFKQITQSISSRSSTGTAKSVPISRMRFRRERRMGFACGCSSMLGAPTRSTATCSP